MGGGRAANELTVTEWDPVSKQPVFKVAAVRVERLGAGTGAAPAPTTAASRPAGPARVPAIVGGPTPRRGRRRHRPDRAARTGRPTGRAMKLPVYLGLLQETERTLAGSFRQVADGHADEPDVHSLCHSLARQCDAHVDALAPAVERYGAVRPDDEPDRLHAGGLSETRAGPVGLLRDLQDLYLLVSLVEITWTVLKQVAQALRDRELLDVIGRCDSETSIQAQWCRTPIKQAAPQALVTAS
jgi:hypothetical protein